MQNLILNTRVDRSRTFLISLATGLALILILAVSPSAIGQESEPEDTARPAEIAQDQPASYTPLDVADLIGTTHINADTDQTDGLPDVKRIVTGVPFDGETLKYTYIISSTGTEVPIEMLQSVVGQIRFLPETLTTNSANLPLSIDSLQVSIPNYTLSVGEVLVISHDAIIFEAEDPSALNNVVNSFSLDVTNVGDRAEFVFNRAYGLHDRPLDPESFMTITPSSTTAFPGQTVEFTITFVVDDYSKDGSLRNSLPYGLTYVEESLEVTKDAEIEFNPLTNEVKNSEYRFSVSEGITTITYRATIDKSVEVGTILSSGANFWSSSKSIYYSTASVEVVPFEPTEIIYLPFIVSSE